MKLLWGFLIFIMINGVADARAELSITLKSGDIIAGEQIEWTDTHAVITGSSSRSEYPREEIAWVRRAKPFAPQTDAFKVIRGTIEFKEYQKGTLRIGAFRYKTLSPHSLLDWVELPQPGPFELIVPAKQTAVFMYGYNDTGNNGPPRLPQERYFPQPVTWFPLTGKETRIALLILPEQNSP